MPYEGSTPTRYLFATVPAAGHVNPAVPIATELVRRGHEVLWLTGRDFRATVESTGARFEPLVAAYDPQGEGFADRFPERAGLEGLAGIRFDLKHAFLDQMPPQAADVRRVLAGWPADLVVADLGFLGAAAQHELGGPLWATIGITPLPLTSRDTAPFGTGLPPVDSTAARLRARAIRLVQGAALRDVERHHQAVRAGLGLPRSAKDVFATNISPYLMLQTGTQAFEYPRSDLPEQVHFVGPLLSSGTRTSGTPVDWRALAAGRPIVVVTQGTVATGSPDLVAAGLRGLADEDVFVVAISAGGDPGTTVPANARFVASVPYDELVPYAAAFVTNGGNGGVQYALAHGVPLVVAGTTEDKPEVAARVDWTGAGINLRTSRPTDDQLRHAVRRLLDEPDFGRAARRVRHDYDRHDPARESADLLELLAASGRPVPRSVSVERWLVGRQPAAR